MKIRKKQAVSNCDTCVFYDWDDDFEAYICTADLDEDELEHRKLLVLEKLFL